MVVDTPTLNFSRKELDLGTGFYTTTNYEQAVLFSEKVVERKNGRKVVNIYDFDTGVLSEFKVLEFSEPNIDWLNFVTANRNFSPPQYDSQKRLNLKRKHVPHRRQNFFIRLSRQLPAIHTR